MLKNICNYSALFLFSLAVLTNPVAASSGSANAHRRVPVKIEDKTEGFYNKFLNARASQSYSVTVSEGQEKNVRIKSKEGVSIKLYMPNGEIKQYREDKDFTLEFHAAGEYVIELQSSNFSIYTLKASTK